MKRILKKIYKGIPFKKEFYTLLKNIGTPSESLYRHLHFNGIIKVKVNNRAKFKMTHYGYRLENEIFWNGLYRLH